MTAVRNKPAREPLWKNWLVLLLAIAVALGGWWSYLVYGIESVHQRVAMDVVEAAKSTKPKAAASGTPSQAIDSEATVDSRAGHFTEIGQTGDAFGAFNALLTALAGAFVFWAGYMQHKALRQAQDEAHEEREARRDQAADARTMAQHAEEANRVSRDALIAAQRAWLQVYISPVEPDGTLILDNEGLRLAVEVSFKNIGNTPALDVAATAILKFATGPDDPNLALKATAEQFRQSERKGLLTVFPGETVNARYGTWAPLTELKLEQAPFFQQVIGFLPLQVVVLVNYRLAIADNKVHQTACVFDVQQKTLFTENETPHNQPSAIFLRDLPVNPAMLVFPRSLGLPGHAD